MIESGEDREAGNLGGSNYVSQGFAGGLLACAAGCQFDESGCYATRFDASGPTIIDHHTGLEWEKKDGEDGSADSSNPHDVDNIHALTSSFSLPDGDMFPGFLSTLNDGYSADGAKTTGCYANHCDWRWPSSEESQTIVLPSPDCVTAPCIVDPAFLPVLSLPYWSVSSYLGSPEGSWYTDFSTGVTDAYYKAAPAGGRAVRTHSASDRPGFVYADTCWILGAAGAACDAACGGHGLAYDAATESVAGSVGTDGACVDLLDDLGAPIGGLLSALSLAASGAATTRVSAATACVVPIRRRTRRIPFRA